MQAGVDTVALDAELKSIIKSGILDLGVLGLWSKDDIETPAQLRNSGPRYISTNVYTPTVSPFVRPVYRHKTE